MGARRGDAINPHPRVHARFQGYAGETDENSLYQNGFPLPIKSRNSTFSFFFASSPAFLAGGAPEAVGSPRTLTCGIASGDGGRGILPAIDPH